MPVVTCAFISAVWATAAIRALSESSFSITPEASITGRKNTERTNALPLNFWFSTRATKKLNTMIATELIAILESSSVSSLTKLASTRKA